MLKDWLKGIDYKVLSGTDEAEVSDVIFDSRNDVAGAVFVCIRGSKIDSHDFIPEVIAKGCSCLVVEKDLNELPVRDIDNINIIYTSDARSTLAILCCRRFNTPSERLRMIGITGTKGKTSSSYMLKKLMEMSGHRTGVLGTNGCVIGDEHFGTLNTTPDSYEINYYLNKMLEAGCDTAIMECSSQGFKMHRTDGIIFDYGIFLNISPDHIGPLEHADFDEYLFCKSRLFTQCQTAIINEDDKHFDELLSQPGLDFDKLIKLSMKDESADIYAHDLSFRTGSEFTGTVFKTEGLISDSFALSIPGDYNVANALSVLAVAADMGISCENIKNTLKDVHVNGRMEVVYKSDSFTVIVDYAHNEISMVSLLNTLRSYEHGRIVLVFGCGGNRSKDRRTGMGAAAAHAADFSVFTSDNSRYERPEDIIADIEEAYIAAGGNKNTYAKLPDRREAIRFAMEHAKKGDIIAVIGKGHEDYQEVNGVRTHFLDREEILKIKDELEL